MGSKIAVVADIHGNSSALKAVLNDIDKDQQIQHIYCLGDLVGIGHETNEVLDLLSSRKDISFVMGNHDEAILKITKGLEPDSVGDEREHHSWIASRLDKKYIPFLSAMPIKIDKEINGKKFLFIHYHLDVKDEFISIDNQPAIHKLDELYETYNSDVVCFGHHHTVHHFNSKERLYHNPSSLGCNHNPLAPYSTFQVDKSGRMTVSFIEVPYDNKQFLISYHNLNVPAKDFILEVFHGNQHLQYNY